MLMNAIHAIFLGTFVLLFCTAIHTALRRRRPRQSWHSGDKRTCAVWRENKR